MSDGDPIILALMGFPGGVYLFSQGFKVRKEYKIIATTPSSKIRSAAVGLVELQGKVKVFEKPLLSPFSQEECVYYSYLIEERVQSGKSERWRTVKNFSSVDPFILADETGEVLVLPQAAELDLSVDHTYRTNSFFSGGNDLFRAGLERLGVNYKNWLLDKPLRASETFLCPGDNLFVLGSAMIKRATQGSEVNSDNLVIAKGGKGDFFFLSDKSEKDVLSKLSWKSIAMVVGGPIAAVLSIAYIFSRFGWL